MLSRNFGMSLIILRFTLLHYDDHFVHIYAGNYRLRPSLTTIKWLLLIASLPTSFLSDPHVANPLLTMCQVKQARYGFLVLDRSSPSPPQVMSWHWALNTKHERHATLRQA